MSDLPPELSQVLGQSIQRSQYQNPLFQAASNQAFAGLPDYAKNGLSMGGSLPPMGDFSGFGGGGGSDAAKVLGSLSPAIIAALVKGFKAYQAAHAAAPYSNLPGYGTKPPPATSEGPIPFSGGGDPGVTASQHDWWNDVIAMALGKTWQGGGLNATGGESDPYEHTGTPNQDAARPRRVPSW